MCVVSFSSEVKEELSKHMSEARHCQIAEIAAMISLCGKVTISEKDEYAVKIHTENIAVAKKFYELLKAAFHIKAAIAMKKNVYLRKGKSYTVAVSKHEEAIQMLKAIKVLGKDGEIQEEMSISNMVVQNTCCKRSFIRGSFLSSGSISDPEKTYHFEIVCLSEEKANQLKEMIQFFEIDAKVVTRKKYYVVYVKEGAMIVDLLNIMEAHVSLMKLENVRILKDMRNSVNRRVNCETANINKTVSAAVKQVEDIKYIEKRIGLDGLAPGLEEIARLRLEQPEATLKELGEMLQSPVGKSGVNHRLRKLSAIAQELRENEIT